MKKILKYKEIKTFITKILKFNYKRTNGSHEFYEGIFKGKISIVTLDFKHDKLPPKIQMNNISSMAKQIGFNNNKEFFQYYESHK